uniref:Uncharacterized protein n=1 Tax=Oscillatoriales cyanobacterium SpSt-402 TaxID=2282168 RepID=A0A832H2S2_9CYAN
MSASSAVLSKDRNHLRIPKITPSNEVLLFVDLAQVISHTPEQIEGMAIWLGYSPELRIAEYVRNGQKVLEPVLLIYQGEMPSDEERLLGSWESLLSQVQPATAVHLRSGQPLAA